MPGVRPGPRFDFEVFERAAAARVHPDTRHAHGRRKRLVTDVHLAALTGIQRSALNRARHEGLTSSQADRCAVAIDLHPCLLWPEFHPELTPSQEYRNVS